MGDAGEATCTAGIFAIDGVMVSAEQFFEAVGSVSRLLHKVRNYSSTGWLNSALGPSAESPSYSLESDLPLQYSTVTTGRSCR
jgi:hypothetical protein